jgi:hypothetical protein
MKPPNNPIDSLSSFLHFFVNLKSQAIPVPNGKVIHPITNCPPSPLVDPTDTGASSISTAPLSTAPFAPPETPIEPGGCAELGIEIVAGESAQMIAGYIRYLIIFIYICMYMVTRKHTQNKCECIYM